MRKDRRPEQKYVTPEPPIVEEVRLKAILGMRPGLYLTILYGLIALLILFFLFFYKGLRDRGTFLRVSTFPPGAAVAVDGNYAGSTPCEVLVKKGERRVTISMPFYRTEALVDSFGGRIFATLFVRPKRTWTATLHVEDPKGLSAAAVQDLAANPHIPEILEDTVKAAYAGEQEVFNILYVFVDKSKFFISSPMQLYSYVKAIASLESNMRILTPESLLDIVTEIIHIKEQYDNSPYWLASVIPESLSRRVLETTWFVEFTRQFQSNYKDQVSKASANTHPSSGDTYRIQGLMFHSVPSGTLIQGSIEDKALATHLPHTVPIQGMFVSETEVPARLFSAFLQENPQWQRSDLEKLLSRGLVTESYLEGWTEEGFPEGTGDLPVTQVSWFAAEAFCRWFSSKLPSFLEGYEARLPTEAEWEWAARGGLVDAAYPSGAKPVTEVFFKPGISGPRPVGSSSPNGYGLRDTSGNVWEWCSDWHSPVAYLFSSWKPEKNKDDRSSEIPFGAEKAVRGGSWANEKELVKLYTRASQPPSWCTPYLGFRIVLARVRP